MRIVTIFFVGLLLTSCQKLEDQGNRIDPVFGKKQIDIGDENYSLWIPWVDYLKKFDDGNVAATNDSDEIVEQGDWRVEIFENKSFCTTSNLGNVQEDIANIPIVGDKTLWTKMPILHYANRFTETVCMPLTTGCSDIEVSEGTCITSSSTYAFCSQSGNRTVFVCLMQQTDNPDLAQQIFSTFRWLGDEEG